MFLLCWSYLKLRILNELEQLDGYLVLGERVGQFVEHRADELEQSLLGRHRVNSVLRLTLCCVIESKINRRNIKSKNV